MGHAQEAVFLILAIALGQPGPSQLAERSIDAARARRSSRLCFEAVERRYVFPEVASKMVSPFGSRARWRLFPSHQRISPGNDADQTCSQLAGTST